MTWSCQFFPAVAGSSWQEPHVVFLLLSVSGFFYLCFVQSQLLLCKRSCPKFNTITRKEKRLKYYWPSDVHAISYPHRGTPFWYVAVFQNDFAFSGKPLIFSTRWGINFMGGGSAGGPWRHHICSPPWILPRIRNQAKIAIIVTIVIDHH